MVAISLFSLRSGVALTFAAETIVAVVVMLFLVTLIYSNKEIALLHDSASEDRDLHFSERK